MDELRKENAELKYALESLKIQRDYEPKQFRNELDKLRIFAKKAVEGIKFAHNEINNSGVVRFHEDDSWSHDECEYKDNPESGKCDFCYGYADIKSILTDHMAKEIMKEKV